MDIGLLIKAAIIAGSLIVGVVTSRFFGNDNAIEESAEVIIKENTGVDIDLSPGSPEKKEDSKVNNQK